MNGFSLAIAFLAGNVATLNPCGFALLPAFLSLYMGTDVGTETPPAKRLTHGLLVGATVTAGFVAVFSLLGIPIALGATALARFFPWATILVGLILLAVGLTQVLGRHLFFAVINPVQSVPGRSVRNMFLFGVGYAIASLGCTLPAFLAVTGSTLAAGGPVAGSLVFLTYAAGMGTVLIALAVGAAFVKDGLARRLRHLVPQVNRITGILLMTVGLYLIYYWITVLTAPTSLLENLLFSFMIHASSFLQGAVASGIGRSAMTIGAIAIVLTLGWLAWQRLGRDVKQDTSPQRVAEEKIAE